MRRIELREIDAMVLFKITFVIFSFIGFILGVFYAISALLFFASVNDISDGFASLYNILRATIGALLLSVLYGIILSFGVLILAKIYNVVSRRVGGITFYLEDEQVDEEV